MGGQRKRGKIRHKFKIFVAKNEGKRREHFDK